jgi:hypothetical protein
VQWSVTIGGGGLPLPVYLPVPVPPPVYVPAPVVVSMPPQRVYVPVIERREHCHPVPRVTRWDVDGDGIPNRYDRVYNPRWDRDGDGIPNRYDQHDDRRWHHGGRHSSHDRGDERGYDASRDGWRYERQIRSVSR